MTNEDLTPSRRNFLRKGLGGFIALLAAPKKIFSSELPRHSNNQEHRWGMVIDLDKCTGCGACVVACSAENNQMLGSPEEAAAGRVIQWLKILPVNEGNYPEARQKLIPMPCQHCENPPCVKVCPVYATFKNEEGIVGQVYARCIGCRYCVNACPYTCKFFNWKKPLWPNEIQKGLNPDVSLRPKGVVEKCLFCHHRLLRAKEEARAQGRSLREGDYKPACAEVCPTKAIVFGDLNDHQSDAAHLAQSPRAFHLLEDLGTEPNVIYLKERV